MRGGGGEGGRGGALKAKHYILWGDGGPVIVVVV